MGYASNTFLLDWASDDLELDCDRNVYEEAKNGLIWNFYIETRDCLAVASTNALCMLVRV